MKLCPLVSLLVFLFAVVLPAYSADGPASKRDDSASEKLGMKLSLQCWTFNKLTFFETVDKANQLGIKYVEIITAETSLLVNERTAAQILEQRLLTTIQLIQALGGGWEDSRIYTSNAGLAGTPASVPEPPSPAAPATPGRP